ncbi:MAG: alpha/beta fold hydrolase, partial [Anaerolineales bacterium]
MPTLPISPKHTLHYIDINPNGSPTVLLLHGLGVTGTSWELQFPALEAGGYRALAPDMRGFGQSSYPGKTSVPLMAADTIKLLEAVGDGPANVAGISMGGTVALQLALDAPRLMHKLVLVNTFSRLEPERAGVWLYFLWRMLLIHTLGLETQGRAVAKRLFPHPEQEEQRQQFIAQIVQANPRGYRAPRRALSRFDAHMGVANATIRN